MRRVKLLARKKQVLDKHSLEIAISKVGFASEKITQKLIEGCPYGYLAECLRQIVSERSSQLI